MLKPVGLRRMSVYRKQKLADEWYVFISLVVFFVFFVPSEAQYSLLTPMRFLAPHSIARKVFRLYKLVITKMATRSPQDAYKSWAQPGRQKRNAIQKF